MSKNVLNLRFGVKRLDGYISSVWRLWATRHGDAYLAVQSHAGISKYSFHQSGICRSAFTTEHGTPEKMNDRAMFKWKRSTAHSHSVNASRVAWIAFPTDFLSREQIAERKEVTWIDAAPSGGATYLELAYTSETENVVRNLLRSGGSRNLLKYVQMPNNEALLIMYYHGDWENKDMDSPATSEECIFPNLLFSANDPGDTGRPVRIIFGPTPKDGDALVLQELGGYKVD